MQQLEQTMRAARGEELQEDDAPGTCYGGAEQIEERRIVNQKGGLSPSRSSSPNNSKRSRRCLHARFEISPATLVDINPGGAEEHPAGDGLPRAAHARGARGPVGGHVEERCQHLAPAQPGRAARRKSVGVAPPKRAGQQRSSGDARSLPFNPKTLFIVERWRRERCYPGDIWGVGRWGRIGSARKRGTNSVGINRSFCAGDA
eukprot:1176353-Prorocentrum_minimum.AAC.1